MWFRAGVGASTGRAVSDDATPTASVYTPPPAAAYTPPPAAYEAAPRAAVKEPFVVDIPAAFAWLASAIGRIIELQAQLAVLRARVAVMRFADDVNAWCAPLGGGAPHHSHLPPPTTPRPPASPPPPLAPVRRVQGELLEANGNLEKSRNRV